MIIFNQIRETKNVNIVPFQGIVLEYPYVFVVDDMCARGSLKDILENEDFQLDSVVLNAMANDIAKVDLSRASFYYQKFPKHAEFSKNRPHFTCYLWCSRQSGPQGRSKDRGGVLRHIFERGPNHREKSYLYILYILCVQ